MDYAKAREIFAQRHELRTRGEQGMRLLDEAETFLSDYRGKHQHAIVIGEWLVYHYPTWGVASDGWHHFGNPWGMHLWINGRFIGSLLPEGNPGDDGTTPVTWRFETEREGLLWIPGPVIARIAPAIILHALKRLGIVDRDMVGRFGRDGSGLAIGEES